MHRLPGLVPRAGRAGRVHRLVSVFVVLVLIVSVGTYARGETFDDVAGTPYERAVSDLTSLHIIEGFPDHTFRPYGQVTRAELAKMLVIASGFGAQAAWLASRPSVFTDVRAGQWYTGYIAAAAGLGIIKGYPDGTFRPNDPVIYQDAATTMLRTAGYEVAAQATGGYPGGYLSLAYQKGITTGTRFVPLLPAIRGDIALMLWQTICGLPYPVTGRTLAESVFGLGDGAPVITLAGVEEGKIYHNPVTPVFTATGGTGPCSDTPTPGGTGAASGGTGTTPGTAGTTGATGAQGGPGTGNVTVTATLSRNGGVAQPFASGTTIGQDGTYVLMITATGSNDRTSTLVVTFAIELEGGTGSGGTGGGKVPVPTASLVIVDLDTGRAVTTLTAGATVEFRAMLRDAYGRPIENRATVYFYFDDDAGDLLWAGWHPALPGSPGYYYLDSTGDMYRDVLVAGRHTVTVIDTARSYSPAATRGFYVRAAGPYAMLVRDRQGQPVTTVDYATGNSTSAVMTLAAGVYGPYTLELHDRFGNVATTARDLNVDVDALPVTVCATATCGTPAGWLTLAAGRSSTTFYLSVPADDTTFVVGTTGIATLRITSYVPTGVYMTSPSGGSLTNDRTPTLAAEVTGGAGAVSVRFQLRGGSYTTWTNVGTDSTPPYAITAPVLADGTYQARAIATTAGGSVTSDAVSFEIDATVPSVYITSPANGSTVGTSTVTLSANASDAHLDCVRFQVSGTQGTIDLGSDCVAPYAATASGLADGTYTARATAYDAAGNFAGDQVTFTVDTGATPPPPPPTAPTVVSARVQGNKIIITFSDRLAGSEADEDAFAVWMSRPGPGRSGGRLTEELEVNDARISGRTLTLVLERGVPDGASVSVTYSPTGEHDLADPYGNLVDGFTVHATK